MAAGPHRLNLLRRQPLIAVVALGAVARIGWMVYASGPPGFGDPLAYLFYGDQLAKGNGYRSFEYYLTLHNEAGGVDPPPGTVPKTAFFPPGYPAFLAVAFWIASRTPLPDDPADVAAALNLLLGVGTIVLVHEIARRLFDRTVALTAATITALFPGLVFLTPVPFSETLFTFAVLVLFLTVLWRPWTDGRLTAKHLLAIGFVLGVTVLIRPFTLLCIPGLAVAWLVAGAGWRRAVAQSAVVLAVAAAVVAPWTLRNWAALDAPIILSSNVGGTFCISRYDGARADFDVYGCAFDVDEPFASMPFEEREPRVDRENLRRGLRFVVAHPVQELGLQVRRAAISLRSDRDGLEESNPRGPAENVDGVLETVLGAVADGYFFAVLGLAAVAVPAFRRRPERLFLALALVGLFASIPLLLYGYSRFHNPLLPGLAVMAAVPLSGRLGARG